MKASRCKYWAETSILLIFLVSLTGCGALLAGGAAGGATYAYTEGWVEREYSTGLDRAFDASLQAAENLGMQVVERKQELASAEIKAKEGDETYWIQMEETAENQTKISVRAGILGDEDASRKVHQAIAQGL